MKIILKEDLDDLRQLALSFSKKYDVPISSIPSIINPEGFVPVNIFKSKFSPLASITKYFRETHNFSFTKISNKLHKSPSSVWLAYKNSKYLTNLSFNIDPSDFDIPLSFFDNDYLSVLECVVLFLKEEKGLTFSFIAKLINRDERTIWTVYRRAKDKNA